MQAIVGVVGDDDDDGNAAIPAAVPGNTISVTQAADLAALADEVGADMDKFLAYLSGVAKAEIKEIYDIPAGVYKQAVQALQAKRGGK
jgi:hypothetical protein